MKNLIKNKIFRKTIKLLTYELFALLASCLAILTIGIAFSLVIGYFYNISHPIPDPVQRGEDLGLGLTMIFGAIGSLYLSIPAAIIIHYIAIKKYLKGN